MSYSQRERDEIGQMHLLITFSARSWCPFLSTHHAINGIPKGQKNPILYERVLSLVSHASYADLTYREPFLFLSFGVDNRISSQHGFSLAARVNTLPSCTPLDAFSRRMRPLFAFRPGMSMRGRIWVCIPRSVSSSNTCSSHPWSEALSPAFKLGPYGLSLWQAAKKCNCPTRFFSAQFGNHRLSKFLTARL